MELGALKRYKIEPWLDCRFMVWKIVQKRIMRFFEEIEVFNMIRNAGLVHNYFCQLVFYGPS